MLTDVKCKECGEIYEDKIVFDGETIKCEKCDSVCEIIPAFARNFNLVYDNKKDMVSWGAEGYSTSQYYREQDKLCKRNIFPMPTKRKEE